EVSGALCGTSDRAVLAGVLWYPETVAAVCFWVDSSAKLRTRAGFCNHHRSFLYCRAIGL
ncbi:MAG: hypothetical protein WCA08_13790, partial [Desulfoferrobacter sp.]